MFMFIGFGKRTVPTARVLTDAKRFQGSPKTAAELASFAPPITEKQQLPLLPCHGSQTSRESHGT